MKFYKCKHCGNIVFYVENKGIPIICCGEKMGEIVAGVVEASKEKHIPVVKNVENKVTVDVGSVSHPMVAEHYITWIALQSKLGCQIKYLNPNQAPQVSFAICSDDEPQFVYAYCNLHGLWKAEV